MKNVNHVEIRYLVEATRGDDNLLVSVSRSGEIWASSMIAAIDADHNQAPQLLYDQAEEHSGYISRVNATAIEGRGFLM